MTFWQRFQDAMPESGRRIVVLPADLCGSEMFYINGDVWISDLGERYEFEDIDLSCYGYWSYIPDDIIFGCESDHKEMTEGRLQ